MLYLLLKEQEHKVYMLKMKIHVPLFSHLLQIIQDTHPFSSGEKWPHNKPSGTFTTRIIFQKLNHKNTGTPRAPDLGQLLEETVPTPARQHYQAVLPIFERTQYVCLCSMKDSSQ